MSEQLFCPYCRQEVAVPSDRPPAEMRCGACHRSFSVLPMPTVPGAVAESGIVTASAVAERNQPASPFLPSAISTPAYWLCIGKRSYGPHTIEQVRAGLSAGRIRRDTLGWCVGQADWRPIGEMQGVCGPLKRRSLLFEVAVVIAWFVIWVVGLMVVLWMEKAAPDAHAVLGLSMMVLPLVYVVLRWLWK
jgi:hypothetical protein